MEQRSEDWFAARRGRVTASRIADMMATTRSGWGASRGNYAWELALERLTGTTAPSFTSGPMQHGIDNEPLARAAYEQHTLSGVTEVGFLQHPTLFAGASPDGLVGDDGMLEIKAPNQATHGASLLDGTIASRYIQQMQFQMCCAGPERRWCDFASFDPRFPEPMRLWVKRIDRDDKMIKEIEDAAAVFLGEVDAIVERLKTSYPKGE